MLPHFVHHAARGPHSHPPCTLAGLEACIAAGAQLIEIDVQALADGDFALLHNPLLDRHTTGHGPVGAQTSAEVRALQLRWRGELTAHPVALLSQVVDLVRSQPCPSELQLDLKPWPAAWPTEERLRTLARLTEPLAGRVRVSSGVDWVLRRLHALAPHLSIGFDPGFYIDLLPAGEASETPPYRTGAFGYHDDHPMASLRWGAPHEYLAERAEALWRQIPEAGVWYFRAAMLAQTLDDGFDWPGFLHARGALVDAWTLDADRPASVLLARRLIEAGVDRVTTNDAQALAAALEAGRS